MAMYKNLEGRLVYENRNKFTNYLFNVTKYKLKSIRTTSNRPYKIIFVILLKIKERVCTYIQTRALSCTHTYKHMY